MGAGYGKICSCDKPAVVEAPADVDARVSHADDYISQLPQASDASQLSESSVKAPFSVGPDNYVAPVAVGTPSTQASTSIRGEQDLTGIPCGEAEPEPFSGPIRGGTTPSTAGVQLARCMQDLSSDQLHAYHALAELVKQNRVDVKSQLWSPDSFEQCLLRFLRARKFDVQKSWAMLSATMEWRCKMNPMALVAMPPEEVVGLPKELILQHFPMWHQGFCKEGRPVIFKNFGQTRIAAMCEHTTMDHLVRFHISVNEKASRLCAEQSKKLNKDIETSVYVLDVNGWQPWGFTAAFEFCRQMAKIDSDHYPERLGRLFVINSARIVYYFWKLIKGFLDPVTAAKVEIHAGRESWEPVLLECIDKDQLPEEYGGTGIHRLHNPLPS